MRSLFIIMLIALCFEASAQKFVTKFNMALPDSLNHDLVRWVDFDNDTLPDILTSGTNGKGETFFSIYKHDTIAGPVHQVLLRTTFKNSAYSIIDFDGDNRMDIVLTGEEDTTKTIVFYNRGNFVFQRDRVVDDVAGSVVDMADMDGDGIRELIISGKNTYGPFFSIYTGALSNWSLLSDTIKIHAVSVELFDFNGDGFNDVFVSGTNKDDKPVTVMNYNINNGLEFQGITVAKIAGTTSVSDLNSDGKFDVLVSGADSLGNSRSMLVMQKCNEVCTLKDSTITLRVGKIFTGDLNSDGKCEISLLTNDTDSVNVIFHPDHSYDTLDHTDLHDQAFGDYDHDGDLDLAQIKINNGVASLVVTNNKTQEINAPPTRPANALAMKIFDRLFLTWDKAGDDHTSSASLTYDVNIESPDKKYLVGSYDKQKGKRLLVHHGNVGPANYMCFKTDIGDNFTFSIQTVDNAYHSGGKDGLCSGTGGGTFCLEITEKSIEKCPGDNISLTSPGLSYWYSFNEGMKGMATSIDLIVTQPDTVFAFLPAGTTPCYHLYVFIVTPNLKPTISVAPAQYVCAGSPVSLSISGTWAFYSWSSTKKGFISDDPSIEFSTMVDDTVKVLLSNKTGCGRKRIFPINISKPILTLENDAYQILQGGSVQLSASGGETYIWSPAAGLDNPNISNPLASPPKTTEYTIAMTDSIGCNAEGKVLMIVEETAFIPTLFTPNEDGKNDELKGYGLGTITEFSFAIYNREGSVVYSTSSVSELAHIGWDGTSNGMKQPAGIYYWKVNGKNNIGRTLLLNGKGMGSIMLIR
jgi:gliding motility-associated-like protein